MAKLLAETFRSPSPNKSSEDEENEREASYAAEIEKEKERVLGKTNQPEEKKEKKNKKRSSSPVDSGSDGYASARDHSTEELCVLCSSPITEKSHQTKGRHLSKCYECYSQEKAQKRSEREREKEQEIARSKCLVKLSFDNKNAYLFYRLEKRSEQ